MAASVATAAFGMLLKISDGAGTPVFNAIAEVKSINFNGLTVSTAEVTHMESPSAHREFIATLVDAGEITLNVNYLPDNVIQAQCRTDLKARTTRAFKLLSTDATPLTWSFNGILTSFNISGSVEGVMEGTISVKLTGVITEA